MRGGFVCCALWLGGCAGDDAARPVADTDTEGASTSEAPNEDTTTTGASADSTDTGAAVDETGSSSSSSGEPPIELACDGRTIPAPTALALDGLDDHVAMGAAPTLGLTTFTLEAWVRRDGAGIEASTGSGGVRVSPIVGKGRGETDETEFNCNYTLGFADNVLAADFEDDVDGSNHPILGTIPVPWGQWHHVAVSYDGYAWALYVDGALDVSGVAAATPSAASVQHFAIGTMMDSEGVPLGAFHGLVDEVRVWDYARSSDQIAVGQYQTIESADGLVGRWALDEIDAAAPDSTGINDGTIVGATFATGAVLDHGVPPNVTAIEPLAVDPLPARPVELGVSIGDAEADDFVTTFYLREVSELDDFTIVVLPDTQYYSDVDASQAGSPDYFHDQTQWVRDNREDYNIVGVIHNGDIVNNGDEPEEWVIASAAMARLETPEDGLPDGVAYGVCVGNHDQDTIGTENETTGFNANFGIDRFIDRGYYGGHFANDNDENWVSFWAGGLQFVVVNLQYDTTPDPLVIDWARSVFEAHPDAFGILNTHFVIGSSANFSTQGQAVYDGLRATQNVHLMTGGHVPAEARRTDVYQGHTIHTMLADYQSDGDGGSGYMRIWEFSPANDELTVRTYSPSLDQWQIGESSEFTIDVELTGVGGEFENLGTIDPAPAYSTVVVDDLQPGRTYEWYAVVNDCAHTVSTPVQRFTTQP